MGTCISKCRPNPPPTEHSSLPQDKLVISQSPCIASSTQISHGHQHPSSTSSSSSASSSTSSTSSSFCASSCSSSLSRHGYAKSESPWSPARRHPHIIVLDPGSGNQSPLGPRPTKFPGQAPATPSMPTPQAPARSQPSKRARSTSPALVRQKSLRSSPEQCSAVPTRCQRQPSPCRPAQARQPAGARPISPSRVDVHRSLGLELLQNTAAVGSRNLASPSPGRRFGGGTCAVNTKCTREGSPRHELAPRDNHARPCHVPTRKERLRLSSPRDPSLHVPRLKRRETSVHPIRTQVEQQRSAKMNSHRDHGFSRTEDMNNPLIALDCFIFL